MRSHARIHRAAPHDPVKATDPGAMPFARFEDTAIPGGRRLVISSLLAASPHEVFEFCRRGENFQAIFPERIEPVDPGDPLYVVDGGRFRFRHHMLNLVPWVWVVDISGWVETDAVCQFTDTMVKGPLGSFRHTHLCERHGEAECRYTDRIEYRGMIGGRVADALITRRYIGWVFRKRHIAMQAMLGRFEGDASCA